MSHAETLPPEIQETSGHLPCGLNEVPFVSKSLTIFVATANIPDKQVWAPAGASWLNIATSMPMAARLIRASWLLTASVNCLVNIATLRRSVFVRMSAAIFSRLGSTGLSFT